jgi:DGQHR domain-containing protein
MLIGQNYQFTIADKAHALAGGSKIILHDDSFHDYYRELYKKIGDYAKFDLLGELGIKRGWNENIQTIALQSTYGNLELFQFMLNPKELLEIATVARREKRGENYYQRQMKDAKIKQIAEFVNKGKILPNSIILSFDKHVKDYVKFSPISIPPVKRRGLIQKIPAFGKLTFPLQFRTCWVIDGQHRLYAFAKGVTKDLNVPIIAFNGLSDQKQAKMFLDINKNQTTVEADLVWDLNGHLTPDEPDGVISNIVKNLNDLGPLKDKISMPSLGPRSGQKNRIKISSLCLVIKRLKLTNHVLFSKLQNPMHSSSSTDQTRRNVVKHLKSFYTTCEKLFPDDWGAGNQGWILDNSSGNVMTRLFENIVAHSVRKNKTLDENYYKKHLKPLIPHITSLNASGDTMRAAKNNVTSEGGKDDYLKKLIMMIREATNDQDFGGDIKSPLDIKFSEFEEKLKEMVRLVLSDPNKADWLEPFLDSGKYGRVKSRAKANGITDADKFYQCLTLGETIGLIEDRAVFSMNFYPFFSDESEFGYSGTSVDDITNKIKSGFSEINKHRKKAAHGGESKIKAGDLQLLEANLEKITQCVNNAIDQLGGEVDQPNTEEEENEEEG